ncbi:hypothetical protein F7725_017069 [Dissostichus mawsoni]|uniref:Uncharacterized protein n=1 Tax=Dissostichus mawsoni TaxID=36200 RepID=A0A7J5Z446_DISMA|nr:hypothetical protein F7725_017069 [Dissostichus mawsoni]
MVRVARRRSLPQTREVSHIAALQQHAGFNSQVLLSAACFSIKKNTQLQVDQRERNYTTNTPAGLTDLEVWQQFSMCGVDVDLEDGSVEEEKEDEFWIGEGVKMLPPPRGQCMGQPQGQGGMPGLWGGPRPLDIFVVSASALLLAVVFSVVLLPAMLLLYAGFLCHSRVLDAPLRYAATLTTTAAPPSSSWVL